MKKVFLAGTDKPEWKSELSAMLQIDHTDNQEEKPKCDFILYVITPEMKGFYSIAEAVQDSNRTPGKTLFCALDEGYRGAVFNTDQFDSIAALADLIVNNGAKVFTSLEDVAAYLNQFKVEIEYNPNMVECLIERDGPTVVTLGKNRYTFKKNEAGHSVCLVMLKDHRDYLARLPDYRIYMKHKLPKPEFTDEELDFMREWAIKGRDQFLAYVNGRIDRFNSASGKIRQMAIDKWKTVLPKMECPIRPPDYCPEELPQKPKDAPGFMDRWLTLSAKNFEDYVINHPEVFKFGLDEEVEKAKEKWERLISAKTGEPWPIATV